MMAYPVCPNYGCHSVMAHDEAGNYTCPDCGVTWPGELLREMDRLVAGERRLRLAVREMQRWFVKDSEAPLPGYWPESGFEAQTMPGL